MHIHCISIYLYLFSPSHDTDDMARMQAAALSGGNPAAAAAAMAAASAAGMGGLPGSAAGQDAAMLQYYRLMKSVVPSEQIDALFPPQIRERFEMALKAQVSHTSASVVVMCEVAFSILSNVNQSTFSALHRVMNNQSETV